MGDDGTMPSVRKLVPKVRPLILTSILPMVVIIDMGGQYTLVIARQLRDLGVRSVILDPEKAEGYIEKNPIWAVIISGGYHSVYELDAPKPPGIIFSKLNPEGKPIKVLGLCYGMQYLAWRFGGEVKPVTGNKEYGPAEISLAKRSGCLFEGTSEQQRVWISHGDSVTKLPKRFRSLARTTSGTNAAMQSSDGLYFGIQFHPEVSHTPQGKQILKNFLELANCPQDWEPTDLIGVIQRRALKELGEDKAIVGFSGGVDSSALAAILSQIVRKKLLLGIVIDGGQLRKDELEEIRANAAAAGLRIKVIHARKRFADALRGITDAEKRRKAFQKLYGKILVEEARSFGAKVIFQGTLAPDRIESGATGGANIKTHHNVGIRWPKWLRAVHPIDNLYKYEVRDLARALRLPKSVVNRQPFPGPGLFVRIIGAPVTPERLNLLREADAIVRQILVEMGVYNWASQTVVTLDCTRQVGVKGDGRVYGYVIIVRGVKTIDFMTADGVQYPPRVRRMITSKVTELKGITRVLWDETPKPPGTTEPM
jgi:GMP synthase (glutamine-hydrolysing)